MSVAALIACANAFVGLGEEGGDNRGQMVELFLREVNCPPGLPWCAAFVHHVGWTSHYDHRTRSSSWPLPATASCQAMADDARRKGILRAEPLEGDVFVLWSEKEQRYHHTGIVISVDVVSELPSGKRYVCTTIEGNTNSDGSANGYTTLRRQRAFSGKDAFIRWAEAEPQRRAS